jgi:succinoglycan biosynthesis transport protein ExoP
MAKDSRAKPADSDQIVSDELIAWGIDVLSARRWWFILTAALVLTASIVVTRHQKPVYRATGLLHIDSSPPKVLSEVNEVVTLGSGTYFGNRQYYQAQIQILQSRDVAQLVVNHLHLATDEHFLGIKDIDPPPTRQVKERIIAGADPVGMLASRVLVELPDESMIAKISIEDTDPEFAQRVVNGLMQAYRDRNLDKKRGQVREAFKDLQVMRSKLEGKKSASQDELYQYEKANDFSDSRRVTVNERIFALNRDWREVHAQRVRAQQEVQQLKRYRGSKDIFSAAAPAVMRDSLVGELKRRWMELEIRRRELDTTYLEKHPRVESITKQMDELTALASKHVTAMSDSAVQTYNGAVAQEDEIAGQLVKARAEDAEIRQAKIQHDQIQARADEDKMFYEKVAKRLAETDMTRDVGVNNVSILDMATVPRMPVRPNVQMNLVIGILLALLAGLGAAMLAEMLDNTVKDRIDIEQKLGIPYLGSIPTFAPSAQDEGVVVPEGKMDLYVHYRPNSRVAEAARTVRTNLLFMRPDKPLHTLLITSGHPREGKTSTSTSLAITLAASTGSCILVDTDLRKPRLHKVFNVSSDVGLTSYILSNDPITKYVRKTDVPGLDLLPCGPLPPNPAEILHTERFKQMVRELMEHYDTVIFDSPPVEIVSDALVLASLVDGVVLVGHAERTRRDMVASAIGALRSVNAPLLGMILSRTSQRGAGYGYYYGKGYRRKGNAYRYRYAADPDQERKDETERQKRRDAA